MDKRWNPHPSMYQISLYTNTACSSEAISFLYTNAAPNLMLLIMVLLASICWKANKGQIGEHREG